MQLAEYFQVVFIFNQYLFYVKLKISEEPVHAASI